MRLPRTISLTVHPERRTREARPLQVDLRVTVLLGIATWAVALAVVLVLSATSSSLLTLQVWVCAAGLGLGLLGLVWERTQRTRYRALGGALPEDDEGAPATGPATGAPSGTAQRDVGPSGPDVAR
ncbi:DUF2530 domain-containing protein [Sanguibacter suaedae]|uniref:DUF2530 domain-containing protein n=1 Tax=Sanguibacter suaedae TaxID=2795737 RepID=A0A934IB22_9MICO|nr:DUF2530 domain-containing protein [Sanguibacter suaedae]MBI9114606.1 DUF2530 domain-containing protein [Sanguibacter suaedae]